MKINVNAFRLQSTRSASAGYIMRYNHANVIMARGKQIGDCPISLVECLTVCEAILMAIHKNLHRIIIESDSRLVVVPSQARFVYLRTS